MALKIALKERNGLAASLLHELTPVFPIIFNTAKKISA
jgi:hypothetical protein